MQNDFYLFTDKPHLSQLVSMDNYIIYKFVDIKWFIAYECHQSHVTNSRNANKDGQQVWQIKEWIQKFDIFCSTAILWYHYFKCIIQ